MTDRDELAAWLRLVETPRIGRASARKLLAAFGSPDGVLGASQTALSAVVGADAAASLNILPEGFDQKLGASWRWLDADDTETRQVVALGDPRYPALLLETADPPLVLWVRGRIELLSAPSIAIVGSRNPTPQGIETARAFAAQLSRTGWTVCSGLALGIDGAAHDGALDGPGSTIAVVGTGLDQDYPARHRKLAARIAHEGAIVSEFAIGTPPLPAHFPVRNRIIAGLSRGTLVVEAAVQSGSLITARMALEAGRDVFAVPGSIHSPQSRGCHALIKQGAKLVDQVSDLVDELGGSPPTEPTRAGGETAPADPLLDAMGWDVIDLDQLVARTGRSAADLSASLLDLELAGRVTRMPGPLWQRVERG